MKTKLVLLFCLLFYFSIQTVAAQVKAKFGKISKSELEMTSYELDTGAHAVVLFDVGYSKIEYDKAGDKGWQVITDRHVRIKIFDKSGFDWGDVEIPLYEDGRMVEKAFNIKAVTYNLLDGNIEKIKLEKKAIFEEVVTKNRKNKKFAMPGIKEGSIIEYKYSIVSDFVYSFQDWTFQTSIPVQWSEFTGEIPDYFVYNKTFKGYDFGEMVINDKTSMGGGIDFGGGRRIDYSCNVFHFGYKNVPAFKLEAYSTTPKNYLARLEFELSSYNMPGQMTQSFNRSWEGINKNLLTSNYFGSQLNKTGLVKDLSANLATGLSSELEITGALYEYVKKNISWDGKYSMYPTEPLNKALKESKGNSADVNFILINMLRAARIEAHPVLVSTRSHGFINLAHPSISQFNHVIAAAVIDGKYLMMDACHSLLPASILHPNDLNGKGRVIRKGGSEWVNIDAGAKYKVVTQATLDLTESGELEGTVKNLYQDYAAYVLRKSIASEGGEEEYLEKMQSDYEGMAINEHTFTDLEDVYKRVTCNFEVSISDKAIDGGDMMYLSPMLVYGIEENPFKLEDRKYPVDYSFPMEKTYSFQIKLPEGYVVEEIPEGLNISLEGKAAQFTYSLNATESLIQLTSRLRINKALFPSTEYAALKEFYNIIVDKHAAQIVLKKKT